MSSGGVTKSKRSSMETTGSAKQITESVPKSKRASMESTGSSRMYDNSEPPSPAPIRNKRSLMDSAGNSSRLLESGDKASAEILSRLGFPNGVDGSSKTSLDLLSVGLMSGHDGGHSVAGCSSKNSTSSNNNNNNMHYDSLHQLRLALGCRSSMAAPSLADLFVDGETPAGVVAEVGVLEEWLAHIDSIIQQSLDADLAVDEFDMSTLLLRKATLYCTLGRQRDSIVCASAALDLVVTAQAFFRLACAHYMLAEYTQGLTFVLEANRLDPANTHIESVLLATLLRLRSRKDRSDAVVVP